MIPFSRISDEDPCPGRLTVTSTHPTPDAVLLTVVGDVDAGTVAELQRQLDLAAADPGRSRLVVDLSRVEFLGCAGLAALFEAHLRSQDLVVAASRYQAMRPLEATGLTSVLTIRGSLDQALGAGTAPLRAAEC
jgi:anti-sigma B factor antagonist